MDIQKKALQIIYEITGIVLKWDKKQLSDKEAMQEIVRTLAAEVDKDEKFYEVRKKFNPFRGEKKILAPLAIGVVFVAVLFVANPFAMDDEKIIAEDADITFEQLDETPEVDNIPKNSVIEEFDNQTISKQD